MNFRIRNRRRQNIIKARNTITLVVIALSSFVFTVYIMLNAYEQVFSRDIEHINALTPIRNDKIVDDVVKKDTQKSSVEHTMNRDQLRYIYIPEINTRIELTQALEINNRWYIRGNKAHIIEQEDNNNVVIYLNQNWRTTVTIDKLKKGDLLFLLSKESNYIFRIADIYNDIANYNLKTDETGIPKVTLITEREKEYRILTAELINSSRR